MSQVIITGLLANQKNPEQVTVMCRTTVSRDSINPDFFKSDSAGGESSNPLVAIAQGSEINPNFTVTALFSMKKSVAMEKFGTAEETTFAAPVDANTVFGTKVCINVCRTTTPNPFATNQSPVTNPKTRVVTTLNGHPVYQHTELNAGASTTFRFIEGLPSWIEAQVKKVSTVV